MSTYATVGNVTPVTTDCCHDTVTAETTETDPAVRGCCGSAEATAAGRCCTPTDRAQAIDAGRGCCG